VEGPYLYRNPFTDDPERLSAICAELLEREILHQGPDTVAAFIAEPVQGAGGLIVPPVSYWPKVRALCDRHDILLIADEVVTGFGRTGKMFGVRQWSVAPDIMSFAKGINSAYVPLGATMVNERVAEAWDKASAHAPIMHGFTYSGHPLACAAALANLDVVEREDLPGNAARVGAKFLEALQVLRRHPSVGDVRGLGLMMVVELVKDRQTKEPYAPGSEFSLALEKSVREAGVLVRVMGHRAIISPALIFTEEHARQCVAALDAALETHDRHPA
jgi:adenosylmethionine-8-amino-7-oxononanoate aminotransferase